MQMAPTAFDTRGAVHHREELEPNEFRTARTNKQFCQNLSRLILAHPLLSSLLCALGVRRRRLRQYTNDLVITILSPPTDRTQ